MTLTVVVAVAANGVIGRDNGLPWHLPADLRHFRELTLGRTLLMGRRTFDSIGRALPGRRTVVLTRNPAWAAEGVELIHSAAAVRQLIATQDVVLAGGGQLYREFWPDVDRLEVTRLDRDVIGDTVFPEIDPAAWEEIARRPMDGFSFVTYQRRPGPTPDAQFTTTPRPPRVLS